MKLVTATICLTLGGTFTTFPISTLTLGQYARPSQNLLHIIEANYAAPKNPDNTRTFYDFVKIRFRANHRDFTATIFPAGKVQIAGLKDLSAEITAVRNSIQSILTNCRGTVKSAEVCVENEHGFHIHGNIIYGYQWWPGATASHVSKTYDTNELYPIGVYDDTITMHGTEMEFDGMYYRAKYLRRGQTYRYKFDKMGRLIQGDLDHKDRPESDYIYKFQTVATETEWHHHIILINGFFKVAPRIPHEIVSLFRSAGHFVSYDPNIYKNINIKFSQRGTALISPSGYVRLCGFKRLSDMTLVEKQIRQIIIPLVDPPAPPLLPLPPPQVPAKAPCL